MIRLATENDADGVLQIYGPVVSTTPISFEEKPPTIEEMRDRIVQTLQFYPWLVFERNGIGGFAYACAHRERSAYRWSVDVSVYVRPDERGKGIARSLYSALFRVLTAQGFHRAFAGVGLPNDASVALHRSAGFEPVGIYREVGYKLGSWRDTQWWQRSLHEGPGNPKEVIPVGALDAGALRDALALDKGA